jgi:hypothetical protein
MHEKLAKEGESSCWVEHEKAVVVFLNDRARFCDKCVLVE